VNLILRGGAGDAQRLSTMEAMRLVPRQLRKTDFPSGVPYYGGRLTPQVIEGMKRPPPGRPLDPDSARLLTALDDLHRHGKVVDQEYAAIRQRIVGGR
jgi:hypothetical protein